jgi:hypothetical protein
MQTVRRVYVYLLAGVALGVMLVGLNLLLTVALGAFGLDRGFIVGGDQSADREQLSIGAAMAVVGLLVWAVHWWLAQRSIGAANPDAPVERASFTRGLYLTAVLAVLLAFGANAAISLLGWVLGAVLAGPAPLGTDLAGTLATVLVTVPAWVYHVWVRRRDLAGAPLAGAAAWLPRLYLYGVALVSAMLLALSLGALLRELAIVVFGERPSVGTPPALALSGVIAAVFVLALVWLGHWAYASALTGGPGWRGHDERRSHLRLAYLVLVIGASAAAVAGIGTDTLQKLVSAALGVEDRGELTSFGLSLPMAAVTTALPALPWLAAWWLHGQWLRDEAADLADEGRPATAARLGAGVIGLVGLAFLAVGTAWMLGLAVDALLGGSRTASGDLWRAELATYLSAAMVGLVLWALPWASMQARRAQRPEAEAASTARRAYLLIALGGAVLGGLASLVFLLYRAFGALLDVDLGNTVSEVSTPLGALLVALAVAAYHGALLRRDQRLREAIPTPAPQVTTPVVRRALVLHAPAGADLEQVLGRLRAQLPEGFGLESAEDSAVS